MKNILETTVEIFGKECKLQVYQGDNGSWWAKGYYEQYHIEGQSAKTPERAVENWERKARMHADY